MIGLTLTVTVSNVRTSIENSMEVQVLVLIFLGLLRSGGRSIAMGIKDSLVQGLTTTSPCLGTSVKGMLGKKIKASDGIASKRSFNSFSSSSKGNFFPTTSSIGAAMRSNPSARVEELDKKLLLFMFTVQPLSQDSNRAIFNLNCRKMHKNESEIHSGNFRVCSADFRVCSGNFRVCFRGEKWQKKWKSSFGGSNCQNQENQLEISGKSWSAQKNLIVIEVFLFSICGFHTPEIPMVQVAVPFTDPLQTHPLSPRNRSCSK